MIHDWIVEIRNLKIFCLTVYCLHYKQPTTLLPRPAVVSSYLFQGHRFWYQSNRKLIYDFLLVINTNLPPIVHRYRDIAFDTSKIAIFGYLSRLTPRRRDSPGTISVKFSVEVNAWPIYQMA